MAALNQERFTPATDDTIEELRNGAKNVNTSKRTSFWLSVWKTWCEGKSIALEIEEHEPAELNITSGLHSNFFMFILLISNHTVFLVQFGINLHLWVFQKAEIAAFLKTHSCKLIPNWTRNRMITHTKTATARVKCKLWTLLWFCSSHGQSPVGLLGWGPIKSDLVIRAPNLIDYGLAGSVFQIWIISQSDRLRANKRDRHFWVLGFWSNVFKSIFWKKVTIGVVIC